MGLFRDSQVSKLVNARESAARGEITEAELIAVVRESTGQELDAAMREFGGYEEWGR